MTDTEPQREGQSLSMMYGTYADVLFVLFPFLYPLFKWVLYVPHNPLFGFIFKAVYSYVCVRSENRSIWGFLKLAFGNRHMFSRKVESNSGVTALMDSQ